MRVILPRDPWPRFRSPSAARAAIATIYALVILIAILEITRSLARADRLDYTNYPQLGELVLSGGDPYSVSYNTWPPFFLLIAIGLAWCSRVSGLATLSAWQIGSVLAVWGTLRLLARCFEPDGREVTFWPRAPDKLAFASAPVIVPFLYALRLFDDNLLHGQINTQVLFLSLLGFMLFREGRTLAGGASLALAASLKAVPVLLLGYFAYKRAWRAIGWTVAFLVLLNVVVPSAVFGPHEVAAQWRAWRGVAPAVMWEPVAHHPNQALLSLMKRLFTAQGGSTNPISFALATWSTTTVVRLFWIVALVGLLGLALAFRSNRRDLSDPRSAAEFAICLGAMTLVSPLAWTAHYVTLVAPAAFAWTARRGHATAILALSFACLTFSGSGFVGWAWAGRLESLSVVTVGALLVLGLAVWLLPRPDFRGPEGARAPGR